MSNSLFIFCMSVATAFFVGFLLGLSVNDGRSFRRAIKSMRKAVDPLKLFNEVYRMEAYNKRLERRIDEIEDRAKQKRKRDKRLEEAKHKRNLLQKRMAELPFELPDEFLKKGGKI